MINPERDAHTDKGFEKTSIFKGNGESHLYSIPSLIVMGFFFVSAAIFVGSVRSREIVLPLGRVLDTSSRVRTVTCRSAQILTNRELNATDFRACSANSSCSIYPKRSFPSRQTFIFCV